MIGREHEIKTLKQAMASPKPEFVAVVGRRRVGKTFLIREFFKGRIDFEMVGLRNGTKEQQLRNFAYRLHASDPNHEPDQVPDSWLMAFRKLQEHLESLGDVGRKKVVFIDELPWVATARSGFLMGLEAFWNGYASRHDRNILLIV